MFSLENQLQLRKISISCLLTCIYLPTIVTVISYKGVLYSVGNGSSFYILVIIFLAELLKSFYLNINNTQAKKNKNRAAEIAKATIFVFGVAVCFFVGIILFGAPVLDSHEETMMLSILLTLLTAFPLVAHAGVGAATQYLFGLKYCTKDSIPEMLVNNALMTVGGAWLGAVVIPLDWNTPWQKWPIPCYLGAIGGYLLSNVLIATRIVVMNAARKHPSLNIIFNILNTLHFAK